MIFSKTFGYALRGILYIALMQDEKRYVQIEEVAEKLSVPRYFLSKVFKRIVKEGLLLSVKGPYGGYTLAPGTLQTPLVRLEEITDGLEKFNSCVLRLRACNAANPCPLHFQMEQVKNRLMAVMQQTKIADLLLQDKERFIKSIATYEFGLPQDKTKIND